ncbi:hypothetical protein R5R35_004641 [Gryllus longicercus]|uniref:COMM domain-containing protein n=1 Tax=Gryllus longicercus TaxID=2509291 RepID=A0AAN9WEB0_9ORTH
MRFRFCGDLDCPDWILAEINTLARMTSIKVKQLCQQVAKSLLGEEIDYEKVKKLASDSKFEVGDVKACVAAVAFVLSSSARHGVDEEALGSELQQLGLPREHSMAICRVYRDHVASITAHLQSSTLRLSRLQHVQWRVDVASECSVPKESEVRMHPEVQLSLDVRDTVADKSVNHRLVLSAEQLTMLISDLKRISSQMDSLQ